MRLALDRICNGFFSQAWAVWADLVDKLQQEEAIIRQAYGASSRRKAAGVVTRRGEMMRLKPMRRAWEKWARFVLAHRAMQEGGGLQGGGARRGNKQ
jgi:hypothetical protein